MRLFLILIFFLFSSVSYGDDGKSIFLSKCTSCHGASASAVSPVDKVSSQWKRFFKRNKHKRKQDISGQFNADELNSVRDYLVAHASDSDQPEFAGQR